MPGMSIASWETEAADHKSPNISSLITSCHLAGAKKNQFYSKGIDVSIPVVSLYEFYELKRSCIVSLDCR